MKAGLWVVVGNMALVVLEAIFSYFNGNFWPSQVMAKWGKAGISFFAHGGMWSDLFVLPSLFAYIITQYGEKWTTQQIAIMALVGVAFTTGNHLLLINTQTIPDPLGWRGEKTSMVITMHFIYMSTYVMLAGLFYFCSPNVSVKAAVLVSVVLGIHMAFGTHIPLGLLNLWHQWSWCPTTFLTNPVIPYMTAGIWIGLTVLSWIAAGELAGLSVIAIGTGLIGLVSYIIMLSPSQKL